MITPPDAGIDIWHALVAIFALGLAGVIAGVLAGLLGVGGGVVIVPILVQCFEALGYQSDRLLHIAIATSLATIIFSSLRSFDAHRRCGVADLGILRRWAPWIAGGAIVGAIVAQVTPGAVLSLIFGGGALWMAIRMAQGRDARARAAQSDATGGDDAISWREQILWASGTGGISSMLGIGGGVLGVAALRRNGASMRRAVGTASGFGVLIAAPGALGYILAPHAGLGAPPGTVGLVNLPSLAALAPATILAAPLGVRLSHALPERVLRWAFAGFLAMVAAGMIRRGVIG